jgi:Zn finger protein HypA/HybF involved in hydrogenase expression
MLDWPSVKNVLGFQCVECAQEHLPEAVAYVCPICGGNLDVIYDCRRIRTVFTRATLAADTNFTIWR